MVSIIVIAIATVSATVFVHAGGTAWWLGRLVSLGQAVEGGHRKPSAISVLVKTAIVLISLHVVEVLLWAAVLRALPNSGLASMESAVYLSFSTFTTLGYGDVVVESPWRILTGIEALNGVLLLGWSTALSFAVVQGVLKKPDAPPRP